MKQKYNITLCVILITLITWAVSNPIFAFEDDFVHPKINEFAAEQSILDGDYLLNELGISGGLDSKFNTLTIVDCLKEGGTAEDANIRCLSHFHDPLKPWDDAGLFLVPVFSSSALLWAQHSNNSA